MTRRLLPLLAFLLAAPALAADPALPSVWRRADVTIDGSASEWAGKLVPLERTPLSIGVQNDASFLYLCLRTSDEALKRQLLGRGLSVFLDATAKEKRGFGVRYPAGLARSENAPPPETGEAASTRALRRAAAGSELVFLDGDGGDGTRVTVSAARPVEAALGEEEGVLVVELQVPLTFSVDAPHAVETQPGRRISIGVDSTEPKQKKGRADGGMSFGPPGGGMSGGGHGGHGGGRGGGPRGEGSRGPDAGEPVKAWVLVELEKPPAP